MILFETLDQVTCVVRFIVSNAAALRQCLEDHDAKSDGYLLIVVKSFWLRRWQHCALLRDWISRVTFETGTCGRNVVAAASTGSHSSRSKSVLVALTKNAHTKTKLTQNPAPQNQKSNSCFAVVFVALSQYHQNDEFPSYLPNFVPKSISPSHANMRRR